MGRGGEQRKDDAGRPDEPRSTSRSGTRERGAHLVWGRAARIPIDAGRLAGFDIDALLEGLDYDLSALEKMRMVPWDDYCVVVENFERLAGGPEACEEILATAYHQVVPEIRALAGVLASPISCLRFIYELIDPIVFPCMSARVDVLEPNRLRLELFLLAGARPCRAFFRGTVGALRGLPCHLGLPHAEVVAEIEPQRAVYDVTMPSRRSRLASLRAASAALAARVAMNLGFSPDDPSLAVVLGGAGKIVNEPSIAPDERLERAALRWSLSRRQSEVLALVVQGKTNKEMANELGCAEGTVELHLTALFRKTGSDNRAKLVSRFWSEL